MPGSFFLSYTADSFLTSLESLSSESNVYKQPMGIFLSPHNVQCVVQAEWLLQDFQNSTVIKKIGSILLNSFTREGKQFYICIKYSANEINQNIISL